MNFVKILINIERLQKRNMPYALVSSASELRARLQRRRARRDDGDMVGEARISGLWREQMVRHFGQDAD